MTHSTDSSTISFESSASPADPDGSPTAPIPANRQVAAARADESARAQSIRGAGTGTTGILVVSHGSRSTTSRNMLLDVHAEAAPSLLDLPDVAEVRSAFMEYTEPSIATQLRALDERDIEKVIVVPLLLTISDHSFEDIPRSVASTATPPSLPDCMLRRSRSIRRVHGSSSRRCSTSRTWSRRTSLEGSNA